MELKGCLGNFLDSANESQLLANIRLKRSMHHSQCSSLQYTSGVRDAGTGLPHRCVEASLCYLLLCLLAPAAWNRNK